MPIVLGNTIIIAPALLDFPGNPIYFLMGKKLLVHTASPRIVRIQIVQSSASLVAIMRFGFIE